MLSLFIRMLHERRGATAIEYGLIAALIATVIVSGTIALGTSVEGALQRAAAGFTGG